ncbi:hypothetical protein EVG20_g5680 [Dentipellis fragilis]|uniref:CHAT domain-containing protein n=1 Tax=Dentipellis fragilis TaxID=205917 RepID=A0A4Y9YRY6_9AGAM|nr:hypothetical protein EVG20_g5680 [Dentipellis fragilis]
MSSQRQHPPDVVESEEELANGIAELSNLRNATPDNDLNKVDTLMRLAALHAKLYRLCGNDPDAIGVISALREASGLVPDRTEKALTIAKVGSVYLERFKFSKGQSDLDDAISCFAQAAELSPREHPMVPNFLMSLSSTYAKRFEHFQSHPDLDLALAQYEHLNGLVDESHPIKPLVLKEIGKLRRVKEAKDPKLCQDQAELDEMVLFLRNAGGSSSSEPSEKLRGLSQLGAVLRRRFELTGKMADIDEAIAVQLDVVKSVPKGDPQEATYLDGLCTSLIERYGHTWNIRDIDLATEYQQRACDLAPEADHLNNLGLVYYHRFRGRREQQDMDRAIACFLKAIQATDHGPKTIACLVHLGNCFSARYRENKDISDLDHAMERYHRALSLTSDDDPANVKHGLSVNLGTALTERFVAIHDKSDIDNAISVLSSASALVSPHHPDQVICVRNLSHAYYRRFESYGDPGDSAQAMSRIRFVALLPSAHPLDRYRAARSWVSLTIEENSITGFCEAADLMMDLVPQVVWLGRTIPERHEEITVIGNDLQLIASVAFVENLPKKALVWLERSRSIVWHQQLSLRTSVEALQMEDPDLARKLENVAEALDYVSTRRVEGESLDLADYSSAEQTEQTQRRLAEQWGELIERVRELPAFKDFLLPRGVDELREATKYGTIVLIVPAGPVKHCSVAILTPLSNQVKMMMFPEFSGNKAEKLWAELRKLLQASHVRSRGTRPRAGLGWTGGFDKILSILWNGLVKPVLDALEFKVPDKEEPLPRIIWCPTGPFSFLPIHTAGLYNTTEPGNKLSDFAISFYTTTVSALLDTPSTGAASSEFRGLLAVSQPNTPGLSTLPSTKQEIKQIKKHVDSDKFVWLDGSAAMKQTIRDQMASSNWLHLTCHAVQHPEPLKSAFWLEDGGLEIGDVISTSHNHAKFAFLSACQTTTRDEKLSEEAVHLAVALQLAGYQSIVATMWSILDEDAPSVADEVYKHLLCDKVPDSTQAAAALHHAMLRLQDETRPAKLDDVWFHRWVPFIHIGV